MFGCGVLLSIACWEREGYNFFNLVLRNMSWSFLTLRKSSGALVDTVGTPFLPLLHKRFPRVLVLGKGIPAWVFGIAEQVLPDPLPEPLIYSLKPQWFG